MLRAPRLRAQVVLGALLLVGCGDGDASSNTPEANPALPNTPTSGLSSTSSPTPPAPMGTAAETGAGGTGPMEESPDGPVPSPTPGETAPPAGEPEPGPEVPTSPAPEEPSPSPGGGPNGGGTGGNALNPAPEPIPANAGAGGTGGSVPVVRQDFATLREAAAAVGRLVGAAVDPSALGQPNYSETLAREFDYVTPENATKWEVLAPSSSTYDWSGADAVIDFARDNAQVTKGHTFVWHLQYPSWLEGLSAADLRAAMQRHIETTLERYRGRVRAWDVVNEAVDVSTPSGYTESVFYRTLGPEFIADAFRIAREADPDVLLFYNEIGIERLGEKSDFTHQMIRDLLDQGVPIDGIGLQSHVSTHRYPSENDLRTNIRRFADLGLLVNISEADSRTLGFPGDRETRWQTQRIAFAQIVGSCVLEPGCEAVTFWGFTDNYSWLNEEEPEDALLFDREYIPKPAYDGAMDGFRGILPVRGRNVVDNPTFAEGAAAWEASGGELRVTTTTDRDGNVACSTARTSEADGILQVDLTSALAEGGPMSFSAMVRVDGEAVAQAAIVVTQGDETTELNVATRLIQPARWFELSGYLGLGFDSPPSNIGLKLYGPPAGVELCVADVALQPLSMP